MKYHCTISPNGAHIRLKLEEGHGHIMSFDSVPDLPPFALEIVAQEIRDEMRKRMEKIRRDAYNLGWSDAKKKLRKRNAFAGCINSDFVGFAQD